MPRVDYRELGPDEIGRVPEIGRAEWIDGVYRVRRGSLELEPAAIDVEGWDFDELRRSQARIVQCLARGGAAWGAFAGTRLIGIAVLDGAFLGPAGDTLDLYFLYVDAEHRDEGLGGELLEWACARAAARGAKRIYVSATPSRHTVDFYRRRGFTLAARPDPELFALEPEDVHMVRDL